MNTSTPPVSPGPYFWHEAQYALRYNTQFQTWELVDITGAVVVAFTRRFMHISIKTGAPVHGWYIQGTLIACSPLKAVNTYLQRLDDAAALIADTLEGTVAA